VECANRSIKGNAKRKIKRCQHGFGMRGSLDGCADIGQARHGAPQHQIEQENQHEKDQGDGVQMATHGLSPGRFEYQYAPARAAVNCAATHDRRAVQPSEFAGRQVRHHAWAHGRFRPATPSMQEIGIANDWLELQFRTLRRNSP
jgi:hypothetical protein